MVQTVQQKVVPEVKVITVEGEEKWSPSWEAISALQTEAENERVQRFYDPRVPVRVYWLEDVEGNLKLFFEVIRDTKRLEVGVGFKEALGIFDVVASYIVENIGKLIQLIEERVKSLEEHYNRLLNRIEKPHTYWFEKEDPINDIERTLNRLANIAKRIERLKAISDELEAIHFELVNHNALRLSLIRI